MDLRPRHPERKSATYQAEVSHIFFHLCTCSHYKNNSNTQERKPVTNSRDTQELLPDAGQEMLRIFSSHPARTSLLQDFAFYEVSAI